MNNESVQFLTYLFRVRHSEVLLPELVMGIDIDIDTIALDTIAVVVLS
jgi:hypothetical protein